MRAKTSDRIAVGIVGSGGMAAQRAAAVAAHPHARLAGLHARSAAKAAALGSGVPFFAEFPHLLAVCDAVILCVPNDVHAGLAAAALRDGKHVLVEYPLTPDAATARQLAAEAGHTGTVLMTGNTMFHESLWHYLQTHGCRLGTLVGAATRVAWHSPEIAGAWYLDPARSGSCFHAFHYHHIALYRRLLGEVVAVGARVESRRTESGDTCLSGGMLTMQHATAATSVIQWYLGTGDGGLSRSLNLTGTSGGLSILGQSGDDSTSTAVWNGGGAGAVETFTNDWGVDGSTREFLGAVRGETPHHASLEDDLRCLEIADCAVRSARDHGARIACTPDS